MRRALRLLSLVIVVVGAVALAGVMVNAGKLDDFVWWPLVMPLLGLNLVPHALLLRGLVEDPIRRSSAWIGLIGALAISGFALWGCLEAFVWRPSPQSGLVFFILPILLIPPAALFAFLIRWRERRAAERGQ